MAGLFPLQLLEVLVRHLGEGGADSLSLSLILLLEEMEAQVRDQRGISCVYRPKQKGRSDHGHAQEPPGPLAVLRIVPPPNCEKYHDEQCDANDPQVQLGLRLGQQNNREGPDNQKRQHNGQDVG